MYLCHIMPMCCSRMIRKDEMRSLLRKLIKKLIDDWQIVIYSQLKQALKTVKVTVEQNGHNDD